MREFNYTITDENGIHARPAGLLVKEAAKYASDIKITKDGKSASTKKLFAIMSLGVKNGNTITVSAEGLDEETAIEELEKFFSANL